MARAMPKDVNGLPTDSHFSSSIFSFWAVFHHQTAPAPCERLFHVRARTANRTSFQFREPPLSLLPFVSLSVCERPPTGEKRIRNRCLGATATCHRASSPVEVVFSGFFLLSSRRGRRARIDRGPRLVRGGVLARPCGRRRLAFVLFFHLAFLSVSLL